MHRVGDIIERHDDAYWYHNSIPDKFRITKIYYDINGKDIIILGVLNIRTNQSLTFSEIKHCKIVKTAKLNFLNRVDL